jgi:predicted hydrocarbon binding protein
MSNERSAGTLQDNSLLEKVAYDCENGELRIAGTDWILMAGSTLRSMMEGISKVFGTGTAAILLEAGKCAGKEFTESLLKEGTLLEEVPTWLEIFFTQGGWGKIKARADFANKTAVVVIDNCATTRGIKSREVSCHFVRGYVAGISEILFKTNVECVETRCMAKGDAYCEFRVQSQTH